MSNSDAQILKPADCQALRFLDNGFRACACGCASALVLRNVWRLADDIEAQNKQAHELVASLDKLTQDDPMEKLKEEFAKIEAFAQKWKATKVTAEKRCREHKRGKDGAVKPKDKKKKDKKKAKKRLRSDSGDDDDDADEEQ